MSTTELKSVRSASHVVMTPSRLQGPLLTQGADRFRELLAKVNTGEDPRDYFVCTCFYYCHGSQNVGRHFTVEHESCKEILESGDICDHRFVKNSDIQVHYALRHPERKKKNVHRNT